MMLSSAPALKHWAGSGCNCLIIKAAIERWQLFIETSYILQNYLLFTASYATIFKVLMAEIGLSKINVASKREQGAESCLRIDSLGFLP